SPSPAARRQCPWRYCCSSATFRRITAWRWCRSCSTTWASSWWTRSLPTGWRKRRRTRNQRLRQIPEEWSMGETPCRGHFRRGDRIRIREGLFAGDEGEVTQDYQGTGLVAIVLTVFGREVPLQVEKYLLEKLEQST